MSLSQNFEDYTKQVTPETLQVSDSVSEQDKLSTEALARLISAGVEFVVINREWNNMLKDMEPSQAAEAMVRIESLQRLEIGDDQLDQGSEKLIGDTIVMSIQEGFARHHRADFRNAHSSLVLGQRLAESKNQEFNAMPHTVPDEQIHLLIHATFSHVATRTQLNSLVSDLTPTTAAQVLFVLEEMNQTEEGLTVYLDEAESVEAWYSNALISHLKVLFSNLHGREFRNTLRILRQHHS